MIIHSFDPSKGKQVVAGEFDYQTFTFSKKVTNRHYMVIQHGYGISEDVIQQLIHLGCNTIVIKTKNKEYTFKFEELLDSPIKDYGSGKQRFLKIC